ncbi:MAG: ParA family partition ATPase [Hyphomicrobiales bacterium]|nr:ParA family partition ATPase [Hyphomicrobiales bacterium]
MKTLALVSQKGGSGKTTLCLNLAIAATLQKKTVVVIDLDPQQSAARWARLREAEAPVILPGHGPNLAELVARAADNGADVCFIDTAPKSENAALTAAKLANLVLIPCQPSNLDLDAVADSVNIVTLAKANAAFVLNNCRASTGLADDAAEALTAYILPLAPVRIGSRVAFVKSLTEGKGVMEYEPKGAASAEIAALMGFARKQGGM